MLEEANGSNRLIQGETGSTGGELILNGATLIGVWVSGFNGRQIMAHGARNLMSCVKVSTQNPK